VTTKLN